jgi:hypothetical protein
MIRPRRYGRTLDIEVRPGHCAFCDAPFRPPRVKGRIQCGSRECLRAYNACYRERRKLREAAGLVLPCLKRMQRQLADFRAAVRRRAA